MRRLFVLALLLVLLAASAYSLAAPEVTSTRHPDQDEWYNTDKPWFEWEEVSDATGYKYTLDSLPETDPGDADLIETTTVHYPEKRDGIYYFHIKACNPTECSAISHYKIQLDKTTPSATLDVKVTASDAGAFEVTWSPAEDALSGISHYKVYRKAENDFDIREATDYFDNITETSYLDDDNSLIEGRTYFYKVVAYDKAGNQGKVGMQGFARRAELCDVQITINLPDYFGEDTLSGDINFNAKMYRTNIELILADTNTISILEKQDLNNYHLEYSLSGISDGDITLKVTGKDSLIGEHCEATKTIHVDRIAPQIEVLQPTLNTKVSDTVRIEATASDQGSHQTGIADVSFYYTQTSELPIATVTDTNEGKYLCDWNTLELENGRAGLKAIASDNAGNTAEQVIYLTIENKGLARAAATKAKQEAKELKDSVESEYTFMKQRNLLDTNFLQLKTYADQNYSNSTVLFNNTSYEASERYANTAKTLYQQALETVNYEIYSEKQYAFNKSQITQGFNQIGLTQDLIQETQTILEKIDFNRTLEIIGFVDNNQAYYVANIVVAVHNRDNNVLNLKLVEYIPKEFANNAEEIYSDENFLVLKSDPIFVFTLGAIGARHTTETVYGLKEKLSKSEADSLIDGETINTFPAVPIILLEQTAVTESSFNPGFQLPNFFNFDFGDNTLLIVAVAVGAILVIVIVVLVVIIVIMRRPKREAQTRLAYTHPESKGYLSFLKRR